MSLAIAIGLAACSLYPGASLSPRELALKQLNAQQQIWEALKIDDYVITVEEQCFCPSSQFEVTVVDGIVRSVIKDTLPVRPDQVQRVPKTVPELFALVRGLPADAVRSMAYDVQLGFPTTIEVDPIPNAVDDAYTIVVHDFRRT